MTQGTEINDAVRFDGTVTLNMGDAATDQAGDFRVTGRLSGSTGNATVVEAHEILVLDAGQVIERGTHAQLLAQQGHYARMWSLQQSAD